MPLAETEKTSRLLRSLRRLAVQWVWLLGASTNPLIQEVRALTPLLTNIIFMTNTHSHLQDTITDIIGEAAMQLPPLGSADREFLRRQTNKAVSIFLRECTAGQSADTRDAICNVQGEDQMVVAGMKLDEILTADPVVIEHAMEVARAEVLKTVRGEYDSYRSNQKSNSDMPSSLAI